MKAVQLGLRMVPRMTFRGPGVLGGLSPDPQDPDSPDGRFRILNQPARGRISVFERRTMLCVVETLSATDGTWWIDCLSRDFDWVVIGWDGSGAQNAAIQDWVRPALPE